MKKQRIRVHQGQFYVDDYPTLLMAGEIHYFRLPKSLWEVHLQRLKAAGCRVVSTYVPWLIHEPLPGTFEFQGQTLEQYDLGAFLTLCEAHGFLVFLRPGPYVMAELHAEGLAADLHTLAELKPLTWGKVPVSNGQIDLLHPTYLARVKTYYQELFNFIKPFLAKEGGPVELIQLDNEVGMLAWVSQSPPLTDDVVTALGDDFDRINYQFLSGAHERGHQRLGQLLRERYARYIGYLKELVTQEIGETITLVNIHGTSGGRGLTFPIGYSQLLLTFNEHVIGTDIYYERLSLRNAHDYYWINSNLNALKHPQTPATCLEFNAGNSNFGDNLGGDDTVDSMDKKIRLLLIQGHKLINFYLFSGGMNPTTHPSYTTANGRIAITGERHGFAAPVKLSGAITPMYTQMQKTLKRWAVYGPSITWQKEVTSTMSFGLMLDHYMTESMRHGTEIEALKVHLTQQREGAFIETFFKHALLLHTPMQTVHLERQSLDVKQHPILVISSAAYMAKSIQEKLVTYLQDGGKLLSLGALPTHTLDGEACTRLLDYLEIEPLEALHDTSTTPVIICSDNPIEGYHTFKAPFAQRMKHAYDCATHDREGFALSYVRDRIVWLTHAYPGYPYLTQRWLDHLGVEKPLQVEADGAVYVFKTEAQGGALVHILNFESVPVTVRFTAFPFKEIIVRAYDNLILPLGYRLDDVTLSATCEVLEASQGRWTFETCGLAQDVLLTTSRRLTSEYCVLTADGYRCHLPASVTPVTIE